jgi:hypothetical protein
MLTYLLQKLDEIKRQRNLYCSEIDKKDQTTLVGKELFLYQLICKNLREK